jgi:transposase
MFSNEFLEKLKLLEGENRYLKTDLKEYKELADKLILSITELKAKNEELTFENKSLKDKINKDSSNTSLPPSKDLYKKNKLKKKSDKKRGGQIGHQGSYRPLLDPSKVTEIVRCMPGKLCGCGGNIRVSDIRPPIRHQVFELPEVKPIITEYRQFKGKCRACDQKFIGKLPAGVPTNILGPRAMAFIAQGSSLYHLSKSQIQRMLHDSLGIKVSISTISNVEKKVSRYCEKIYNELHKKVRQAAHLHIDETGHKSQGRRGYAWFFVNNDLFLLKLARSRGMKVLKEVIGENFAGRITSDRYSAYNMIDAKNRQVCWAHLLRDFRKFAHSQHEEVSDIGKSLLKNTERIFDLLKALKLQVIDKGKFNAEMEDIRRQIETQLYEGSLLKKYKNFGGSCANIYKLKDALWNFLESPELEATNNLAERSIRPFVIRRKISFGTESERGDRFLERMMSIIPMIIKSGKKVLEAVTNIIRGGLLGKVASLSEVAFI